MKIIEPCVGIVSEVDGQSVLKHLEACGHALYGTDADATVDSATYVKNLLAQGEDEVLKHESCTVKIICEWGVANTLNAHVQLPFVSVNNDDYIDDYVELVVVRPMFLGNEEFEKWKRLCRNAEEVFFDLLDYGYTTQEASAVLPYSTKSVVLLSADLREWRNFFEYYTLCSTDSQVCAIVNVLLKQMQAHYPVIFDDYVITSV